ncbi:MAG: CPBP family intramembrane metalloprotease [Lewinellaceae bacterium]|nr:CPBP family intramembrane metalloprotease [Lewinellaceae bacterium]MCB9288605.1 CPBP family intramembrane metalloprotease [Lewinellaceae bacterium]
MSFFEAARRGDNSPFKYVITIIAVVIGAFVGQIPLGMVVAIKVKQLGLGFDEMQKFQKTMDFSLLGLDSNLALFLLLLSFVAALGVLFLCVTTLHDKRFTDILTGRNRLDWGRVGFAFVFWFGLSAGLEVAAYFLDPGNYTWQFEPGRFLPLLLISLLILPLQTTFEEALFRGYLMQGFGLLFRNRWAPLLLTSAGFGLLHFANPEVDEFGFWLMMAYYIGVGLVMGFCTLMDEGAELALGLHAATNIYGATIVSFSGSALQTQAIFRVNALDAPLMLSIALVSSVLFILVAGKKYKWADWAKLFRRIEFEEEPLPAKPEEGGPVM